MGRWVVAKGVGKERVVEEERLLGVFALWAVADLILNI